MNEFCPRCYSHKGKLHRAIIGFFAWHLWRMLPMRLAFGKPGYAILPYAGEWIYDTRACGCGVPLERDDA